MVIEAGVERLRQAIMPTEPMRRLVSLFYKVVGPFAGTTFLGLAGGDANKIEVADLLAVTLMGEIFPPHAVRQLLYDELGEQVGELLAKLPTANPMWTVAVEELHDRSKPASKLWHLLLDVHDVGATKVSKLMARKRPALIPIFDSVIGANIATVDDYWYVFHAFLSDQSNRDAVKLLRPEGLGPEDLPALRLLDTAVWMRYSGGRSAQAARSDCGL